MKFLDTHELVISTLSPVHIGCGEDYEPTNYVIEGDQLHAFDPAQLLAELDSGERDKLLRALGDRQPVLAVQRFFYRHRERALKIARYRTPIVKAAADFYQQRIGKVAQQEAGHRQVINKLEIARTAFDANSQLPVLPGSSLKGAIRTAILEQLRKNRHQARFPVANPADRREASHIASEMEKTLLEGSFASDPFRLVKFSDAHFQPGRYKAKNGAGLEIERERQPRIILFQAKRKKKPNQFAAQGAIETLVECVPAGQPSAFRCTLTIERKARQGSSTPSQQFDYPSIARACNAFYLPIFNDEMALLEANRYVSPTWAANARARLAATGPWGRAIAENRGFLLRVGRHSGAESVTIDAPRRIKIMHRRNEPPTWEPAATILWLAANEPDASGNLQPFGWVFVRIR